MNIFSSKTSRNILIGSFIAAGFVVTGTVYEEQQWATKPAAPPPAYIPPYAHPDINVQPCRTDACKHTAIEIVTAVKNWQQAVTKMGIPVPGYFNEQFALDSASTESNLGGALPGNTKSHHVSKSSYTGLFQFTVNQKSSLLWDQFDRLSPFILAMRPYIPILDSSLTKAELQQRKNNIDAAQKNLAAAARKMSSLEKQIAHLDRQIARTTHAKRAMFETKRTNLLAQFDAVKEHRADCAEKLRTAQNSRPHITKDMLWNVVANNPDVFNQPKIQVTLYMTSRLLSDQKLSANNAIYQGLFPIYKQRILYLAHNLPAGANAVLTYLNVKESMSDIEAKLATMEKPPCHPISSTGKFFAANPGIWQAQGLASPWAVMWRVNEINLALSPRVPEVYQWAAAETAASAAKTEKTAMTPTTPSNPIVIAANTKPAGV